MANKITLTANDGSIVEFYDEIKAQGGVKDVYFSPDKTYVVAFYRKPINANDRERITNIVGIYRQRIFDTPEGNYWKNLFAWPTKMVEWNGKTGIIMPFYDKKFFFSSGPFKGKEKEGKWFASAKLRNKFLPADQKGKQGRSGMDNRFCESRSGEIQSDVWILGRQIPLYRGKRDQ